MGLCLGSVFGKEVNGGCWLVFEEGDVVAY